ncbi:MAG: ATP-binding protein [Dongiaceae bacterium]
MQVDAKSDTLSGSRSADRRQVTALAYDMAGSSRLSVTLDPEDFADLLRTFHERCLDAVRRYGGHIDNIAGDGGMIFFGFPRAHEDDAERAVLAGLEIVSACTRPEFQALSKGHMVAVRVGIATGVVVAGAFTPDDAGRQGDVMGPAPYVAFKLQSVAEVNSVAISTSTREIVGTLFDYRKIREVEISAGAPLETAWRVLRERPGELRLQAIRMRAATPLVSRVDELSILEQRWRLVEGGRGQVVLIRGEAGIGKSRLAATAKHRIAADDILRFGFQCTPQHSNTALYPLSSWLDRRLELAPVDWPADRLERLEHMLSRVTDEVDRMAPIVAHLLSIPSEGRYPPPQLEPDVIKERAFGFLMDVIARVSRHHPLPILVEDLQWIDPTSQELLDLLVETAAHTRMLLIFTVRADHPARWIDRPHVTLLNLQRLGRRESAEIVTLVARDHTLPREVIDEIVDRADGIPLFLEELTLATVAAMPETQPGADAASPKRPFRIPATLADSLTARLDLLGPAKEIVQVAAAIGRNFRLDLARNVAGFTEAAADALIRQLTGLGLATVISAGPNANCTFKHALIQEAAYQSMLRGRRKEVHRRIAEALRRDFTGQRQAAPEILAQHYEYAGMELEAIAAFKDAADIASARSANVEAARLLEHALRLQAMLPAGRNRDELELSLLVTLGPIRITTSGPGTQDVQSAYRRAIELCEALPRTPLHFATYWGWWRIASNAQELRKRADILFQLAAALDDAQLLLQAHHCQWGTLFGLGEYETCRQHIASGIAIYDKGRHEYGALYGGHDPKVCALHELALCLWLMGLPDQSLRYCELGIAHADSLQHAGSTAQSKDQEIILHRFRDDAPTVLDRAGAMMAFAEEHGIKDLAAKGLIFRGWAATMLDDGEAGVQDIAKGLSIQRSIGTEEDFPLFFEMAAQCFAKIGQARRGIELIEEAIGIADRTGARYWLPEAFRCMAELRLRSEPSNVAEAFNWLERARDVARSQQSRSLLLRNELSMARLLVREGHRREARERIDAVYATFTEGFDTIDLKAARDLLAALEDG